MPTSGIRRRRTTSAVAGSNDQLRRRNLSRLLNQLHESGPTSRAELTRITGLNRSTVGDLVSELVGLGLVHEREPNETGTVGRPSPVVHANDQVVAIGVNPDVDAILLGVVGLGGVVHRRIRQETGGVPTVAQTVEIVVRLVEELRRDWGEGIRLVGMGLALPGLVRVESGTLDNAPHLDWHDVPIAQIMEEAVGIPVYAANDANTGIVAERLYGAARGIRDVVYLHGSASGIGGGVIVEGRPLEGEHGFAGELGHVSVDLRGTLCFCGQRGCLETEVSLARLLVLIGRESIELDELDQLLAETEDPVLLAEVDRQLDILAFAIRNLVNVFNPELVVLAGFLASMLDRDPDRLYTQVHGASFKALSEGVRVERDQLHTDHLLIGAAQLPFETLIENPAAFRGV